MSKQIPFTPELEEKIIHLAKAQQAITIIRDLMLKLYGDGSLPDELWDKMYLGVRKADDDIRRQFDDIKYVEEDT